MSLQNDPVFALQRFGLGLKPGQRQGLIGDMRGLLKAALREESARLEGPALGSSSDNVAAFQVYQQEKRKRREQQNDAVSDRSMTSDDMSGKMGRLRSPRNNVYMNEIDARLSRFRDVETGILERLTLFWANHFTVSVRKSRIRVMAGSFEREAIRPHVTGRFVDLLKAVTAHPAMLIYLDNHRSIGPKSTIGRRRGKGLNENLARELLELHTLGVDGGYSQDDVTETAKILTGWSLRGMKDRNKPLSAAFLQAQHEPGPKTVLGQRYPEAGEDEALALLEALAAHPATARHIAEKLARHFVADVPPAELTQALETIFLESGGDLREIYDVLIDHPLCWDPSPGKLRTPQEWLAAAVRALDADMPARFANRSLEVMGHRLWAPPSPEGYEDRADAWLGGAMIKARMDWAAAFADRFAPGGHPLTLAEDVLGDRLAEETALAMRRAATREQAFEIMLLAPEMMRR